MARAGLSRTTNFDSLQATKPQQTLKFAIEGEREGERERHACALPFTISQFVKHLLCEVQKNWKHLFYNNILCWGFWFVGDCMQGKKRVPLLFVLEPFLPLWLYISQSQNTLLPALTLIAIPPSAGIEPCCRFLVWPHRIQFDYDRRAAAHRVAHR